MSACISDLKGWLIANKLQLNDDKTKVLLVSSPFGRHPPPLLSLAVNNFLISPTGSVRNLGVILDSHLTMEEHICSVLKRSFSHFRRIARVRKFLHPNLTARLVLAFLISLLDYGNSLFAGLHEKHISQLQQAQNATTRKVSKSL